MSYSGEDFGIDLDVSSRSLDLSKFSNFTFEDFDADFPLEGNSSFSAHVDVVLL